MENFIECFECAGSGEVESTSPICFKPASECCGGCYEKYTCKYCEGSGEIHPLDEEMNDNIMMLKSYYQMLVNFHVTQNELKKFELQMSEDALATYNLMVNKRYAEDLFNLQDQIKRIDLHVSKLEEEVMKSIDWYRDNKY
jgi:hypothetical protein